MTEDDWAGWHPLLNGREFEQTPGDSEGQGSLVCYNPRGCKKLEVTESVNNNNYLLFRWLFWSLLLHKHNFSLATKLSIWVLGQPERRGARPEQGGM